MLILKDPGVHRLAHHRKFDGPGARSKGCGLDGTHRPPSSSFLWFVFRILYGNPKEGLLRGLWVQDLGLTRFRVDRVDRVDRVQGLGFSPQV